MKKSPKTILTSKQLANATISKIIHESPLLPNNQLSSNRSLSFSFGNFEKIFTCATTLRLPGLQVINQIYLCFKSKGSYAMISVSKGDISSRSMYPINNPKTSYTEERHRNEIERRLELGRCSKKTGSRIGPQSNFGHHSRLDLP